MKKEDLVNIGLNEDQMKEVFKLNGIAVENVRSQMSEIEENLEQLKVDKADLEDKLANKPAEVNDNYKQAEANLLSQLKDKDAEIASLKESTQEEINRIKFDSLLTSELKDAGAKNIKAALAVINLEDVKLSEDGNLEGLDAELERVTSDVSTKFIFGTEDMSQSYAQKRRGASAPGTTKSSIMAIKDTKERQEAIKENIQLFK